MGERGKMPKRKDGSIADDHSKQPAIAPLQMTETEADPVSPTLLEKLINIRNRYRPLDPRAQVKMTNEELFESEEAEGHEIHKLSSEKTIETALIIRGFNLWSFLENPENRHLYSTTTNGAVTIDEMLLRYAAKVPMTDHPDDTLQWPAAS